MSLQEEVNMGEGSGHMLPSEPLTVARRWDTQYHYRHLGSQK